MITLWRPSPSGMESTKTTAAPLRSASTAGVGAVAAGTPKKVGKMACRSGWFWSIT